LREKRVFGRQKETLSESERQPVKEHSGLEDSRFEKRLDWACSTNCFRTLAWKRDLGKVMGSMQIQSSIRFRGESRSRKAEVRIPLKADHSGPGEQ